ncbi:MAG: hypothetical protein ACLFWB_08850 [Armatimonadota bacterium]
MPEARASQNKPVDAIQILGTIRELLLQQRRLILQEEPEKLLEVSRRIKELMDEILQRGCNADEGLHFDEATGALISTSVEERELLVSVRNHARLNSELLADAVTYTDLTLEMLFPGSAAGTYDENGQRGSAATHELNKSA